MDINSLYTNIDIKEGLQAIKDTFLQHPDPSRPYRELLKLLFINLTLNESIPQQYNYYLQINGTAMGKQFAPSHANIFMAAWEKQLLQKVQKQPEQYYRYLDDIWGVWTHSMDFSAFLQTANNINPSITVKVEIHAEDYLVSTKVQPKIQGYKGMEFLQHQKRTIWRNIQNKHTPNPQPTTVFDPVKVTILETNPSWTLQQRRRAKRKWIKRLNTRIPEELNEKG